MFVAESYYGRDFAVHHCQPNQVTRDGVYCKVAVALGYFAVTCFLLVIKLQQLRQLPYAEVQTAVVFYRLQVTPWKLNLTKTQAV